MPATVAEAAAAAALPPRAAPMLPHTGGLFAVSTDVLRMDGALPAVVGPRERLAGRFGESPGSGDRSRVPNLAFAVD